VNAPGFGGLTALHHAAQTHRNYSINNPAYLMEESQLEPLAKLLIKNGANVDALIPDDGSRYAGATPLHLAADGQNLPVIKELIANGANVNARKRDGLTPLGVAILAHHMKAAAVLVAAGVRLEQRDVQRKFESRRSVEGEMTLLCHILLANPSATSVHLTELFISAGADVNAASELMGRTPLMYAIMGTFANHEEKTARLQMVALLIRNGADPNREGNNRNSALDIARSQAKWAVAALRGEKQAETTTPHEPSQPVADMHGEKQAKTTTPHEPSRPVADLQGEKHAGTTTAHELPTGRQWWEFWK
jgi:ankyrin repeat protein